MSQPYGNGNTVLFLGFADTSLHDKTEKNSNGEGMTVPFTEDLVISQQHDIKIHPDYLTSFEFVYSPEEPRVSSTTLKNKRLPNKFRFNRAHSKVWIWQFAFISRISLMQFRSGC